MAARQRPSGARPERCTPSPGRGFSTTVPETCGSLTPRRLEGLSAAGYVDLRLSVQGPTQGVPVDNEPTVNVTVPNTGTATTSDVRLVVHLDPTMKLLGRPYYQSGSGCTGRRALSCFLDFLPAHRSTGIRFGVRVTSSGLPTITADVTSDQPSADPAATEAYLTIPVAMG